MNETASKIILILAMISCVGAIVVTVVYVVRMSMMSSEIKAIGASTGDAA